MRSIRIPFFKIWYSSAFVILFLITFVLTLVSPADLIYQSAKIQTINDIISVGGVYFLTAVCCLFIWASRIYTNRAVLRDIPKSYIPIDHGEVPRKVRRLIEKMWRRSALVAWDSRPRDVSEEVLDEPTRTSAEEQRRDYLFHHRDTHGKGSSIIPASTALRAWGHIAHPGWSAPDAANDQPQSIQYWSVLIELPHLLEAKAVSLAPPDPSFPLDSSLDEAEIIPPDPQVVSLLQRPQGMGLRDYISHLQSLNIIANPDLAEQYLQEYEQARFSTRAATDAQFTQLMTTFSSLLSSMSLDINHLTVLLEDSDYVSIDSISNSSQLDFARARQPADIASLTSDLNGSVHHHQQHTMQSSSSPSTESFSSVIVTSQS